MPNCDYCSQESTSTTVLSECCNLDHRHRDDEFTSDCQIYTTNACDDCYFKMVDDSSYIGYHE